jgi:hypothetical protein
VNPFTKIYNEIKRKTVSDIRKILEETNKIERHAIITNTKIYTGGLEPERILNAKGQTNISL